MTLSSGDSLSFYSILGTLGAGAMGEVYRAMDTRLDRQVAIKVLPEHFAAESERLMRFEREAKALAALNHPNVAQIFNVDQLEDTCFLVLELVEGETLEERLERGALGLEQALDLCAQIADGIEAAHAAGIIHRDLKPANVRITPENRVKVLDFGLAKSAVDSEQEALSGSALMTAAGRVLGTPTYMAPEQARGASIDLRADIWAWGCLLFECLAGSRAFEGNSVVDVLAAVIERDPDWSKLPSATPQSVIELLKRCLSKDPGLRPRSMADLRPVLRSGALQQPLETRAGSQAFLKPPPVPSTALLGRAANLQSAIDKLQEGARLLTVTGYGGTGKTRFATELYRRLSKDYAGGAAFVSLASVTSAPSVLPTICLALDIAEAHGRSHLDALCTVVGEQRVLLVLDNLEQVLDAAEDIAALVTRCPSLQVIATSRAPLKLGIELEFALPPLALPATGEVSPASIESYPSVELFVQRAKKVRADFLLSESNAEAVASICRRLDGLPLALELAAARTRILDPMALLQRLDQALDLLTSGDRDLPLRQRTLRATISWSYSLLDASAQQTLRRCSVFHEGWTLEALEHVCFAPEDRGRALDELDALVEQGLIRVIGQGERFALLETVRAFAAEQLHAGGEVDALREAHGAYYLKFSAGIAAGILGTDQRASVQRALADNANTMAAIHWFLSAARRGDLGALEQAMLLCGYLDWYWHIRGHHLTARVLLDEALLLAKDLAPSRGRALCWLASGLVSTATGELERSLEEWTSGQREGLALGDEALASEGSMGMGYCLLSLGRLEQAAAPIEDCIARGSNGVARFMCALGLAIKGMLLHLQGDLEAGMPLVREALRMQQEAGDNEGSGLAYSFLAQMTFAKGDHAGAMALYRDALAAFQLVGDRPEIARVHSEMGWTALAHGEEAAAREAFCLAVQAYEEVGSPRGSGQSLLGLAAIEAAAGRDENALAIAAAGQAQSERAGVVVHHPMDPGVQERIEALKTAIQSSTKNAQRAQSSSLSPAAALALAQGR